jgi:YVTN family beta-propeller protein
MVIILKMRNFFFLITCHLALVTVLSAQWVEATIPVGDGPRPLVYNSTDNKVYCANAESNNVTVIDGATDTVITTVPAGDHPWALVYNSLNNKVYCANAYSNNVTVIDGATDSVITTIPVGGWPYALVYNSMNKKVYCANATSDNVTIIDGATDSVITTIAVGGGPSAFAWNPIQNRTYVANYWSNTVSVIKDSIIIGIEEDEIASPNRVAMTKGVEIYPNPARSFLAVRLPQPADRQNIKIFDALGKLVKEAVKVKSVQSHKQEVRISLKGISPGIYFLKVGKETKKFLVVK